MIVRKETKVRFWRRLKQPDGSYVVFCRCDRCGKIGRQDVFAGMDYCPSCGRVITDIEMLEVKDHVLS